MRGVLTMGWTEKGLVYEIVASAKNWFPNDIARFNFYLDLIKVVEKEDKELCGPGARAIDPMFEKALVQIHPYLKENEGVHVLKRGETEIQ